MVRWPAIFAVGAATLAGGASGAPVAAAGRPDASLVEARLTRVEDITGQAGAPCFCDAGGHVLIDGSFRLTFQVSRTLAGRQVPGPLDVEQASAQPRSGLDYLLVVTRRRGEDAIAWKGLERQGLCLAPGEAAQYGLVADVKAYPCRR
jgi:hypothetical protein